MCMHDDALTHKKNRQGTLKCSCECALCGSQWQWSCRLWCRHRDCASSSRKHNGAGMPRDRSCRSFCNSLALPLSFFLPLAPQRITAPQDHCNLSPSDLSNHSSCTRRPLWNLFLSSASPFVKGSTSNAVGRSPVGSPSSTESEPAHVRSCATSRRSASAGPSSPREECCLGSIELQKL